MKIEKKIELEVKLPGQLNPQLAFLVDHAERACKQAYAPYSNFKVGAAVQLEDGIVVRGNNQENAAYPSGLCAERVALFAAKAQHPDKQVTAIAIVVEPSEGYDQEFTPSCGACLQVMSDIEMRQEKPIQILIRSVDYQVYIAKDVKQFLPFNFKL
jgi:cytidine deaminase